jgi:hypothetical protein
MWKKLYDRLYSPSLPFGRNFQHIKNCSITKEQGMARDLSGEVIFASPEKEILSQPEKEK